MERTPLHKRDAEANLSHLASALRGLEFLTCPFKNEMLMNEDLSYGVYDLFRMFADLLEETKDKQEEEYMEKSSETRFYKRKYEDLLKQTSHYKRNLK